MRRRQGAGTAKTQIRSGAVKLLVTNPVRLCEGYASKSSNGSEHATQKDSDDHPGKVAGIIIEAPGENHSTVRACPKVENRKVPRGTTRSANGDGCRAFR